MDMNSELRSMNSKTEPSNNAYPICSNNFPRIIFNYSFNPLQNVKLLFYLHSSFDRTAIRMDSSINTMEMLRLLDQQKLEGKRSPMIPNSRRFPSFCPHAYSSRAGGFVDGIFRNRIRPREYFFQCMAVQEGFIDKAVKTARIGCFQRCLTKHSEGLVVNYDLIVRDSDGSVVQFLYGENDGLAMEKCNSLKETYESFMVANKASVLREEDYTGIVVRYGSTEEQPINSRNVGEGSRLETGNATISRR